MDIGFDTIIYIIIGVIFLVAQIAKKKRKEEAAKGRGSQGDSVPEKSPGQTILEQLLGIPEQRPSVERPVDDFTSPDYDLDPLFPQPGPQDSIVKTVNEAVKETAAELKVDKSQSPSRSRKKSRRDFDLKKAIIYQAILERKNY
jgi:hypothetical protein